MNRDKILETFKRNVYWTSFGGMINENLNHDEYTQEEIDRMWEKLEDLNKSMDWSYQYSDDHRVYARYSDIHEQIRHLVKILKNFNPQRALKFLGPEDLKT